MAKEIIRSEGVRATHKYPRVNCGLFNNNLLDMILRHTTLDRSLLRISSRVKKPAAVIPETLYNNIMLGLVLSTHSRTTVTIADSREKYNIPFYFPGYPQDRCTEYQT